jgi:hypothetical protein
VLAERAFARLAPAAAPRICYFNRSYGLSDGADDWLIDPAAEGTTEAAAGDSLPAIRRAAPPKRRWSATSCGSMKPRIGGAQAIAISCAAR